MAARSISTRPGQSRKAVAAVVSAVVTGAAAALHGNGANRAGKRPVQLIWAAGAAGRAVHRRSPERQRCVRELLFKSDKKRSPGLKNSAIRRQNDSRKN